MTNINAVAAARIRWTYFLQNGGSFSSAIESISQEQRDCFTHESRSVLFRTYSCFRLTLLHVASYLGSMSTVSIRILTFRPHLRSQGSSVHSRPTLRLTGKLIKAQLYICYPEPAADRSITVGVRNALFVGMFFQAQAVHFCFVAFWC